MKKINKFLDELQKSNAVLVAGSYARGEETESSDIDFQIKTPKECIIYGIRNPNLDFIIGLLKKYGIKWNSTRTGYISTIGQTNDIPTQMEFYDYFHRNKNRQKSVSIMGVQFRTH